VTHRQTNRRTDGQRGPLLQLVLIIVEGQLMIIKRKIRTKLQKIYFTDSLRKRSMKGCPSLSHSTDGLGLPVALHVMRKSWFVCSTTWSTLGSRFNHRSRPIHFTGIRHVILANKTKLCFMLQWRFATS